MGSAPALAESTAGVEPAGEAERATAAKSDALVPRTQGESRGEVETLWEGKREAGEPPPQASPRKAGRMLEELPQEGKRKTTTRGGEEPQMRADAGAGATRCDSRRKPDPPPRRDPNEGALTTWDPGGKLPEEGSVKSKRHVEAIDIVPGIDAHIRTNLATSRPVRSGTPSSQNGHAPWAIPTVIPSHRQEVHPVLS